MGLKLRNTEKTVGCWMKLTEPESIDHPWRLLFELEYDPAEPLSKDGLINALLQEEDFATQEEMIKRKNI